QRPPAGLPKRAALVLISNQAAYVKGKTDLRSLWLAHERFVELLASEGVRFEAVLYSYGHPNAVVPHFQWAVARPQARSLQPLHRCRPLFYARPGEFESQTLLLYVIPRSMRTR